MEKNDKDAVPYNFIHPGHKLNTQWPVLDLVSQKLASEFANELSERLQVSMLGTAPPTTRSKYSECISSIGLTGTVHEMSLTPLTGSVWFCMDISVISAIVNCYFGGSAELIPLDKQRCLSKTELRVLKHVLAALISSINNSWNSVVTLNCVLGKQLDVERLVNTSVEQVMVSSNIVLSVGEIDLPCQIVYPFETLNPISAQLQKEKTRQPRHDDKFSDAMRRELLNCELEIRGVLAESNITLGTLLELKAGDFIALRDVQNVAFKTQNMPLFDARVGNSNGRVSASVSRWHLPVTS